MIDSPSSPEKPTTNRRDFLTLKFTSRQREQSPAVEKSEKWEEFEPILLNGSKIRLLGVSHGVENFPEMKDKIDEIVNWSDIVLLEYLPFETENQPIAKFIHDLCTAGGLLSFAFPFYNQILTSYKDMGKPIGSIDPEGIKYTVWKNILGGAEVYATGKIMVEPIRRLLKRKGMTRREFLRTVGVLVPAVYLEGRFSLSGIIARFLFAPESIKDYNYKLEDTLLADTINYRDVRSAENMVRLTKVFQEKGGRKILYIAGRHHPKVVRSYVTERHDLEKMLKVPFHTLHSLFAENDIRLYSYKDGSWVRDQHIT